jgi:hypothetical protein
MSDLTTEQVKAYRELFFNWLLEDECGGYAESYAEPGYTDPESGIIAFANWNNWGDEVQVKLGIPADVDIETDLGIEQEWSDEWYTCECGKAIRTEPDSYGWVASYLLVDECEIVCIECVKEDIEAYMHELVNRRVNGAHYFDPSERGFIAVRPYIDHADDDTEQYGTYQHGLHDGQADSPEGQLKILNDAGFDVVFDLSSSQFYVEWVLWVRPQDVDVDSDFEGYTPEDESEVQDQVREILARCGECKLSPSPAERMKAMLRHAG